MFIDLLFIQIIYSRQWHYININYNCIKYIILLCNMMYIKHSESFKVFKMSKIFI